MAGNVEFAKIEDLPNGTGFARMFEQAFDGIDAYGRALRTPTASPDAPVTSSDLADFAVMFCAVHVRNAVQNQIAAMSKIDTLPEDDQPLAASGVLNGTVRAINATVDVTSAILSGLADGAKANGEDLAGFYRAEEGLKLILAGLQLQGASTPKQTHATSAVKN
jgi:hypothetical protein